MSERPAILSRVDELTASHNSLKLTAALSALVSFPKFTKEIGFYIHHWDEDGFEVTEDSRYEFHRRWLEWARDWRQLEGGVGARAEAYDIAFSLQYGSHWGCAVIRMKCHHR